MLVGPCLSSKAQVYAVLCYMCCCPTVQARSLVQLLQQTQSLRYIIQVAQKAVAKTEAQAAGMSKDDIAAQLDAAK